jgi:transglutaminase-like putative cysteine protease
MISVSKWKVAGKLLLFLLILLHAAYAIAAESERLVALRATITVANKGDSELNPYYFNLTIPAEDHALQRLARIEYSYDDKYTMGQHANGVDKYLKFTLKIPPRSTFTREVIFHLRLNPYDYKKEKQAGTDDPGRYFLKPSKYVESNSPEVRRIAENIKSANTDKEDQLLAAYMYPQLHFVYRQIDNRGALYALRSGIGDCTEYAATFVAIARALDIPARLTSEFLFTKRIIFSEPNHHAAEVYLRGHWIPVDPNLALAPSLGYGFGRGATSKVILKRDGSWVWSARAPKVPKQYRDDAIKVDLSWDVKVLK